MQYRRLGRTGLQISELSYGTWVTFSNQIDARGAVETLGTAYDLGVNFFDCAEVYAGGEAETILGAALKQLGWRRGSYLVSTKLYWGLHDGVNERNTLNRKRLLEGIRGSLQRLQLEYVDLVFCHRPDPMTTIEETVWAMHDIINQGRAFYWATSEWPAADILAAIEIAERHHLHKPVAEQPEYNLFHRQRFEQEYARVFADYGYGATTWSPLASGLLTGKYEAGIPSDSRAALKGYGWLHKRMTDAERLTKVKALGKIAKRLDCALPQLALAWVLKNPNVSTVITGASRVDQLRQNIAAGELVNRLTADVVKEIEGVFGAETEGPD
ncbi:MAG TPA: aldo/keto reductase [Anaerolineales bacterium]|nr:aldo/keto reductase [Anaerolineales bacterium]